MACQTHATRLSSTESTCPSFSRNAGAADISSTPCRRAADLTQIAKCRTDCWPAVYSSGTCISQMCLSSISS
ncbi:hypothetical protein VTG60DRAFT_3266 [Thermothelomyces hinnuleus]